MHLISFFSRVMGDEAWIIGGETDYGGGLKGLGVCG